MLSGGATITMGMGKAKSRVGVVIVISDKILATTVIVPWSSTRPFLTGRMRVRGNVARG